MSHIEIVLPFGMPPETLAPDLLHELDAPALATMVSRTRTRSSLPRFPEHARALPHEAWFAEQFGLSDSICTENSPPFVGAAMHLRGLAQAQGHWFILHPAHIEIGHSEMVMADRRTLDLSDKDALALFEAAQVCFDEAGKTVLYGDAMTWFIRADAWHELRTATPDMACQRNLAHWMPEGDGEAAWRKLLNTIQMTWHAHPVNAERIQRGLPSINSLWLWGGGSGAMPNFPAILPYTAAYRFAGRMEAYGQFFPENDTNSTAESILKNPPEHGLVLLDDLIAPALAGDWHEWRNQYQLIDQNWLTPILAALQTKRIDRCTLVLSNDAELKIFSADRMSLLQFWRRQKIAAMLK